MTATATQMARPAPMTLDSMREAVKSRIRSDEAFGFALLSEAIEVLLADDLPTAKSVLFDYIEATIGFEALSVQADIDVDALSDMFSPAGDPRAGDLFRVLSLLQRHQGIQFQVSTAA